LRDLQSRQNALSQEIEVQTGVLESAIAYFREQFTAERDTRATEYAEALEKVETALATARQDSETILAKDKTLHDQQIKEFKTAFDSLQQDWDEEATAAAQERATKADEYIRLLDDRLTTAKNLVEMIGEVTMTGHYQKNALEQKTAADSWRKYTVWAGVATIISAIASAVIGYRAHDSLQWNDYASHAGVTVAFAALTTFLGNQSLRHRRREETYRALELELAVLDPFLTSLGDDERIKIKSQLAMRYFAGIDPDSINFDDRVSRS
jgi:soluble cytochrome b562